MLITHQLTAY